MERICAVRKRHAGILRATPPECRSLYGTKVEQCSVKKEYITK
ncbi:hypothetical protein HMPREF3185_01122 [Porphyromonas somerae]|uniref:Uncharacterized protein n=1 Tax=Porphyromonas somerae TaxID=322095 RepID=A0A134B8B6_9PORP|nr:hypothetical protein HMPREF3184_01122 [Porphyromonadaceae bacterium KA00676]KXB76185.1 hypothetical protein HMPREF3185_01122 [Porphyromonas somerae]